METVSQVSAGGRQKGVGSPAPFVVRRLSGS